jgi:hypothetical protein
MRCSSGAVAALTSREVSSLPSWARGLVFRVQAWTVPGVNFGPSSQADSLIIGSEQ